MNGPNNLFANISHDLPAELIEPLLTRPGVRMERIVSRGHCSPSDFWYDQAEDEWVLLLEGAARLRFEDGEVVEMTPGSYLDIPAHRRHRVEWTDPQRNTVWLAVFFEKS
jgi:cupin 2 domain-containing protein